jgi:hypothetical protein
MNVFVITACYNFTGKLDKYVESFLDSYNAYKGEKPNFHFIFVCDQPGAESDLLSTITKLDGDGISSVAIINNKNLGVTRSRNLAVTRLYEDQFYKNFYWAGINPDTDYLLYFDADDVWDIKSVELLSNQPDWDLIFYPCDIEETKQDNSIRGYMTLGEFCTYVPHLECTYVWKLRIVFDYMLTHGHFWYESSTDCKLFPEDMIFLTMPEVKCLIVNDTICHCSRTTGNYCNDWRLTIHKNILSFRRLAQLHRENMKNYKYPEELVKYVEWLESYFILDK